MNDFDQILELELRHLLDPVVATPPPARRARSKRSPRPILTVQTAGLEFAAGAIPVVEPVMVTMPLTPARQLSQI